MTTTPLASLWLRSCAGTSNTHKLRSTCCFGTQSTEKNALCSWLQGVASQKNGARDGNEIEESEDRENKLKSPTKIEERPGR